MNWRNVVKKIQSLGPGFNVSPHVAESQQHTCGTKWQFFKYFYLYRLALNSLKQYLLVSAFVFPFYYSKIVGWFSVIANTFMNLFHAHFSFCFTFNHIWNGTLSLVLQSTLACNSLNLRINEINMVKLLPVFMVWPGGLGLATLGNLSQSEEDSSCIFGKITSAILVEFTRKGWIWLEKAGYCWVWTENVGWGLLKYIFLLGIWSRLISRSI